MGVRERRKEKEHQKVPSKPIDDTSAEQETPKADSLIDDAETGVAETPSSEELESVPVDSAPESVTSQTSEDLRPRWGNLAQAEWMYNIPPREEDMELWAEEWADFLMMWAESRGTHVLSVSTFVKEKPFSDMLGKADAFRLIGDSLVNKDVGEWLDEKKRQLRVYWRPLEEWGDLIYKWAIRTGKLRLDVQSIIVQESIQDFSKLPERDLHRVMGIMVEKGLARWIDSKRGAILILV